MMRKILLGLVVLIVAGCGGGSPAPTGPTPSASNPNVPPAGLDTEWKQLVDGAGNPGAARARLLWVNPPPGAAGATSVSFKFEVCMDAVPNPSSNPNLAGMQVIVYHSHDGIRWNGGGAYAPSGDGVNPYHVRNGECAIVQRLPVSMGGVDGVQFILFSPGSTHLILTAAYRMGQNDNLPYNPVNWPTDACPSLEQIASSSTWPRCVLRSSHFLDYRW